MGFSWYEMPAFLASSVVIILRVLGMVSSQEIQTSNSYTNLFQLCGRFKSQVVAEPVGWASHEGEGASASAEFDLVGGLCED